MGLSNSIHIRNMKKPNTSLQFQPSWPTYCLLLLSFFFLTTSEAKASVTWGYVQASQWQDSVIIEFQTLTETNNQQFWLDVPQLGLLTLIGPHPSSVVNSTTPTTYRLGFPLGLLSSPFTMCFDLYSDDGSGPSQTPLAPQSCLYWTSTSSDVWPGDANSDGAANVWDFLNLGVANGTTGPARPSANLTWTAQYMAPWPTNFLSNINHKHGDCDGNGTIDLNDTLAIAANYGLTHNKTNSIQANGVPLTFVVPDSANGGDTVEIEIWLGAPGNPVTNAYGIAFAMNYDSSQVKTGKVHSSPKASWLGTPGLDLLRMEHDDETGRFDVAFTRFDGMPMSGNGHIGSIDIVLVDNLGKTSFDADLLLDFIWPTLIDQEGKRINVAVERVTVGKEKPQPELEIAIFPQPSHSWCRIQVGDHQGQQLSFSADILNLLGQPIHSLTGRGSVELDVSLFPTGSYILLIRTSTSTYRKKLEVIH